MSPTEGADGSLSIFELASVVLRWRWLVVGLPLVLFVLNTGRLLLRAPEYTATATFMPQRSDGSSRNLGNVAAQLGLTLPTTGQGDPPTFYIELIRSRAILLPVLETTYSFTQNGSEVRGSLIELYGIDAETELARQDAGLRELRSRVGVDASRTTDIVSLSVRASAPQLAEQIVARILELVNQFNVETRQSRAAAERSFVEARLAEARGHLRSAENELQQFLQRNREFRNSPELLLVHGRLEREVSMRQQIYTTLAQAYEQARIEEVRNIPVITIVEPPAPPAGRDARGTLLGGVLALSVGFMIAVVLAFSFEFFSRGKHRDAQGYLEFRRLLQQAGREIRLPWSRSGARD